MILFELNSLYAYGPISLSCVDHSAECYVVTKGSERQIVFDIAGEGKGGAGNMVGSKLLELTLIFVIILNQHYHNKSS